MRITHVVPFVVGHNSSRALAVVLGLISATGAARATVIQNLTGLSNPATVYTFGGPSGQALYAANTPITTQFPGITISPQLYYDGNSGTGDGGCVYTNSNPNCVTNFTTSSAALPAGVAYAAGMNSVPTFTISFLSPQVAAAFSLVILEGDVDTVSAYSNGVKVDSVTANTGRTGTYYGFTNESFDSITVSTVSGSGLALINNLEVGIAPNVPASTPEPGTAAVFIFGLGGLFAWSRRGASASTGFSRSVRGFRFPR